MHENWQLTQVQALWHLKQRLQHYMSRCIQMQQKLHLLHEALKQYSQHPRPRNVEIHECIETNNTQIQALRHRKQWLKGYISRYIQSDRNSISFTNSCQMIQAKQGRRVESHLEPLGSRPPHSTCSIKDKRLHKECAKVFRKMPASQYEKAETTKQRYMADP